MRKDLRSAIRKVVTFLDKKLSDEQIDKLWNHLQFDTMKDNSAVNHKNIDQTTFMRKGKCEAYKQEMSAEWIMRFNAANTRLPVDLRW